MKLLYCEVIHLIQKKSPTMRTLALLLITAFLLSTSTTAADYYWVGGSGNWSDISHWATTSGGVITHDQVPTANDNVYFDANSFTGPGQIVTINNENIFCLNMDWSGATGTPVFVGTADKVINIFGSLNFIENMDFNFAGAVRFRAASAATPIETAGHPMGKSVAFVGDGGWILQDSILVDSIITLQDGDLNTNGFNLEADFLHIHIQNSGSLTLGNSKITLHGQNLYYQVGDNLFADFVLELSAIDVPFMVNPGTSLIEFTSNDAVMEVMSTTPLEFNDIYFSSNAGSGAMTQNNEPVSYGEIRFNNDGRIDLDLSADHLILAPGKSYRFLSGFTYSIQRITAIGNCSEVITLEGTESSDQTATFLSNGEAIELDYVNLKNITATGTSNFTANNAADLGNNTGWTINPRSVIDLYWVGGSGDWNDASHWSLTSGGPGGACIPSGTDNVFFDANSFGGPNETVEITTNNVYCRNMTWTDAGFFPQFTGGFDPTLHIFGSLTMIQGMNYSFGGLILFEGQETGRTITTGNHLLNKVDFLGNGGDWTLQDSLKSETFIFLTGGTLYTNDQYVECTEFFSGNTDLARALILGNTTWVIKHFPDAIKDRWNIDLGGTFSLDAGTSTIDFQGIGGNLEHFAPVPTSIAYNRIIFNNDVGFLDNFSLDVDCTIDSLVFNHGGYLFDDFTVNTLILSPGYTYLFAVNTTQSIGNIVAPTNCNELITMRADATGNTASINVLNDHPDLQYLSLRDLHSVGPGTLTAQNSIDLGNNDGWAIDPLGNRTLYWVGGAGSWSDQAHWSLTSGGPGGECVPTLLDDVIFDANSFTGPGQEVFGYGLNGYYCRNITWEENLPIPFFNIANLNCFGSFLLSPNMTVQIPEGLFMSGTEIVAIRFNGQSLAIVHIDGGGEFTLEDELNVDHLHIQDGTFNTNDQSLYLEQLIIQNLDNELALNLGSSYIRITDPADLGFNSYYSLEAGFTPNAIIDPGTSTIELTHPFAAANLNGGLHFNNIIFSGTEGQLHINHPENGSSLNNPAYINLLELGGDAIVEGFHNIDSLLLAPGKSYQLEYDVTQTVNEYLLALGNNCNPIELFSTLPGTPATITSANAEVVGDFIQMQDQIATGGATFYAGTHSTDIGNSNQGWLFESSPQYVEEGFFGPDQTICEGDVLSLSAYNYSPGETYEWSTGSTEATIPITQADTYWARVTFGNMCEIIDTIEIFTIEPAMVELGPDTSFCEGESLLLDATVMAPNVEYTWQDGSTNPTLSVSQPGEYAVELNTEGCLATETINIETLELPTVDLGDDQALCDGESLTLDASTGQSATYEWQDGSTQSTFQVDQSGDYSVSVTANGCTGEDEVSITFNPIPVFSLGADTSLCTGETLSYDLASLGDTYQWQDGSNNSSFTVDQQGQFWLEVIAQGCAFADTVEVTYFETPVVDLGGNQSLCDDESLTLDASTGQPATYEWQDGSTQATFQVDQSGDYRVSVTANGCTGEDEVSITFNPIPVFSLGADTSLCTGETLSYDLASLGDTYQWQDGSNNSSFTVDQQGQFWLEVIAQGCAFADTVEVTYFETPVVDLGGNQSLCDDESLTLDASTGQPATYEWQDGSTQATFQVDQSGDYSVAVTANGCTGEDEVAITFNPVPVFSLGADTSLCTGETLSYDLAGLGDTYEWQDGSNNPSFTVDQQGQFWLQVLAQGCAFADTVEVTYFETPVVDLGGDQALCDGESLTLDASTGQPAAYEWQDGSTQATFQVDQSGDYSVAVTANGCTGEDEVAITFNAIPVFSLGADTSLCTGETLSFDLAGLGDTYEWQDGSNNSSFTVDQQGQFWLQVMAQGCAFADTVEVSYFETPMVDLGGDQSLCDDESLTLDASTGQPATYEWQDGSTQATFQVDQSGDYSVAVTANGCTGEDEVSITFNPIPVFSLGADTSLCTGETLSYDLAGLGDTYEWQDGSNNSSFTVDQQGQFWLEVIAQGCAFADTVEVTYFETPVVDLGGDQALCDGESLTLDASTGQSATYEWQDGSTQSTFQVDQSGDYSVAVTANGCTGEDEVAITFNPIPVFSLGADTSLCDGETVHLDFSGIADTYLWQNGATTPSFSIGEAGQYWLQVSADDCTFADTLEVAVQPAPEVDLGEDQTLCQGESTTLQASVSSSDGFVWQDGSAVNTFTVTQPGIYWLEAFLGECTSRDSVEVDFQIPIELELPDSMTLCSGERITLTPEIPAGATVRWQDGFNQTQYQVVEAGTYSVLVDDGACMASDTVVVLSSSCGKISVYIPNAFSPNDDGINDLFQPNIDPNYPVLEYDLKVFDRWGSLVFSSEKEGDGWDGKIAGEVANFGVYVFVFEFKFEDQGEVFQQMLAGDVTLVR